MEQKSVTSPANPSALPDSWIAKLFERLSCMYGKKFSDMWAGVDPVAMRKLWGERLARYPAEALKGAVMACESKPNPPTLPEFIGLCKAEINRFSEYRALPPPKIDKEAAQKRLNEIKEMMKERKNAKG